MRNGNLRLAFFLLPALLALLAGPGASAAWGNGFIAGSVDAEGTPAEGILVCAEELPITATSKEYCAESQSTGEWVSPEVPPGKYRVLFWPGEENYVAQYWEDAPGTATAKTVTVSTGTIPGIDAELVTGATIGGTVTAAATGEAAPNVVACAHLKNEIPDRCAVTDGGGHYTIPGLSEGSWQVYFDAYESSQELVSEFYPSPVQVQAKKMVTGIDAALPTGGKIGGTVRRAATGAPLAGVRVCVSFADELSVLECVKTPATGAYQFTGLPDDSFKVVFSPESSELIGAETEQSEISELTEPADAFPTVWWNAKTSFGTATPIAITPPAVVSGIDAALGPAPVVAAPPLSVAPAPIATPPATKKPLTCRKGFAKRKVKGKQRCVKLPKKHHKHHRRKHTGHRPA